MELCRFALKIMYCCVDGEMWTHNRPRIILLIAKGCVRRKDRERARERDGKKLPKQTIKQKMTTKSMVVLETEIKTNESKLSQRGSRKRARPWMRQSVTLIGFMILMLLAILSISNVCMKRIKLTHTQRDRERGTYERLTMRWELKY